MTVKTITLCLNCLTRTNVTSVAVGPEKGSQRDPYREHLALCNICAKALLEGDFETLHIAFRRDVTITRKGE